MEQEQEPEILINVSYSINDRRNVRTSYHLQLSIIMARCLVVDEKCSMVTCADCVRATCLNDPGDFLCHSCNSRQMSNAIAYKFGWFDDVHCMFLIKMDENCSTWLLSYVYMGEQIKRQFRT